MSRGAIDPDPVVIDHLRLVTSREHRRRYQRAWRRMASQRGRVFTPQILHEHDNACCLIEPWPVSLAKLTAATGKTSLVAFL